MRRIWALPGVGLARSRVSLPGAPALALKEPAGDGPPDAFQAGREFAHIHPSDDGSDHRTLPAGAALEAYRKG